MNYKKAYNKALITLRFLNAEVKTSARLPQDADAWDGAINSAIEAAVFEARLSNPSVGKGEFHLDTKVTFA